MSVPIINEEEFKEMVEFENDGDADNIHIHLNSYMYILRKMCTTKLIHKKYGENVL